MPISPLSPVTAQALSSSQVLTDTLSLVKELVENALDANATSISVDVSSNALDTIEVKDNGYGVAPDDRQLLAQRHCTSKISSLEDLSATGGKCLGFRGVALASVAEMSSSLIFQTRVEGELIGEVLKFDRQGKLFSRTHKSLPLGATVRVEDFLKYIPVRRQASLKASSKTLARVKSLLQSYALIRPCVRFSLNILKEEKHKANWVYGTKKDATVVDAAITVLGVSTISQCNLKFRTETLGFVDKESLLYERDTSEYAIKALLPKRGCDACAISNHGQYLAVDSRPIASSKGTGRKIVKIFKIYVQRAVLANAKLLSPLLCLDLKCPIGSYDPNIEPAKDDVLFHEEGRVLKFCEDMFAAVYGEQNEENESQRALGNREAESVGRPLGNHDKRPSDATAKMAFSRPQKQLSLGKDTERGILSFAKTPNSVTPAKTCITSPPSWQHCRRKMNETIVQSAVLPMYEPSIVGWQSSMYPSSRDILEEGPVLANAEEMEDEDPEQCADIATDPWTIAKMNAPVRRKILAPKVVETTNFNGQLLTPQRAGDNSSPVKFIPSRPALTVKNLNQLPSPLKEAVHKQLSASNSPLQAPKFQHFHTEDKTDDVQQRVMSPLESHNGEQLEICRLPRNGGQNGTLGVSRRRSPIRTAPQPGLSGGTTLRDIPDVSQRPRQTRLNNCIQQTRPLLKPFMSPIPKPNQQDQDEGMTQGTHPAQLPRRGPQEDSKSQQHRPRHLQDIINDTGRNRSRRSQNLSRIPIAARGGLRETLQSAVKQHEAPSKLQSMAPITNLRGLPVHHQQSLDNLWLRQGLARLSGARRPPTSTTTSALSYRSPSPDPPISIKISSLTVCTSIPAISLLFIKIAGYNDYLKGGDEAPCFPKPFLALPTVMVAAWEKQIRQLLAKRGRNGALEGDLDLVRAFTEHAEQA